MKSILYDTKPSIRQMYLDPRTKILLCVTVSFVMIASDNTGVMRYVLPWMALIPLAAFIILKKYAIAAYYAVLYMISIILPDYAMEHFPAIVNILFTGIIAIFTKILPGMSMFSFLILTTTVSEFVAAMDSLHIPKSFTIPVSVMFRFFPTIKEEYSAIRDAMRLRNVGSWRNPMEMLEYRMVPLLTGLLSIGNELSASALTRGLDAPNRRTNVCPIGFHWQDAIAMLFCTIVITLYALSSAFGW